MSDTPYFDAYMRGEKSSKSSTKTDWSDYLIPIEERAELFSRQYNGPYPIRHTYYINRDAYISWSEASRINVNLRDAIL